MCLFVCCCFFFVLRWNHFVIHFIRFGQLCHWTEIFPLANDTFTIWLLLFFFYCNDFINITLNIHIKSCQYMCLMCGRSTVMENGWRMKVSFYGMEHQRSKSELFNRFSSHQLWMGFKIAINLYPNLVFPHW